MVAITPTRARSIHKIELWAPELPGVHHRQQADWEDRQLHNSDAAVLPSPMILIVSHQPVLAQLLKYIFVYPLFFQGQLIDTNLL